MALSQTHESRQLQPVSLSHADRFSDPQDAHYGIEPGEVGPSAPPQPEVQYQPAASMPGTAAELLARKAQRAKENIHERELADKSHQRRKTKCLARDETPSPTTLAPGTPSPTPSDTARNEEMRAQLVQKALQYGSGASGSGRASSLSSRGWP